ERVRRGGADEHDVDDRALVVDLARAHLRLGDYEKSARHWESAVKRAAPGTAEHASALRVLGLAAFWCGRHEEALGHLRAGLESAEASGVDAEVVHLRLVRSHCLQELGRGGEALSELETALPQARALGNLELLARVHRSLALLQLWIGPPEAAEQHALQAIELARQVDDLSVEFWARWGLAVLKGMAGDTTSMADGLKEANDLAEKLRSPVLRLWTAEMSIELAYGTGDWDGGVSLGEQSIALARSMNQKPLLSRLLALTSLFYMGRGDLDRAKVLVDEACETSGMYEPGGLKDVHRIVPAYTGLAHYLVALGDYADAIAAARRGLDIAEGTGYKPWAVHRLLPIYAEACLWAGELGEAERVGAHMRTMAERMNHRLGIAWADACEALIRWKRGDAGGATADMRAAAERLEEIPMIPYAVRIRRQLAGRLADIGDTDAAVAELRRVHDVLAQLGAEIELEKCRIQFRELGHRPPPKGTGEGMAGLTARELEIARLVALRKSNQAIGRELGISPRTVSTHLSNVFQKLDISSRAMLGDMVREQGLLE
ncbi:MAG TPA: LuxR C-terminal-related transcriptional regulator, partial [Longimicrobiales bacterium]|nr:LuxR C-terminal-related transcriptional regulator [Longimicrobiales bacterium]